MEREVLYCVLSITDCGINIRLHLKGNGFLVVEHMK